jgi:hypothetical protein
VKAVLWIAVLLLAAGIGVGVLYLGMRALAVERQGFAWAEMDWNQDGKTTLREFFMSSEVGERPIARGDEACVEYFHYKDGSPIRVACEPITSR